MSRVNQSEMATCEYGCSRCGGFMREAAEWRTVAELGAAEIARLRVERDALQAEVLVLRQCVSASLHGSWQEKANAYAALRSHDKRVRDEVLRKEPTT